MDVCICGHFGYERFMGVCKAHSPSSTSIDRAFYDTHYLKYDSFPKIHFKDLTPYGKTLVPYPAKANRMWLLKYDLEEIIASQEVLKALKIWMDKYGTK